MTTCKSCGARIIWAILPTGKRCPIDEKVYKPEDFPGKIPPAYWLNEEGDDVKAIKADSLYAFHVSHFVTCPSREQHRKGIPK